MDKSKDLESISKEKRKIYFLLIHFSTVFLCIYTPYRCLESIQSSLNFEGGLGVFSLGILQGANTLSCVLIGAPFVYHFQPKWSLFLSFFSHTVFILANCSPSWITMIPSSVWVGIMSGPIWVSQGTYLTLLAQKYSELTGESLMQVLPKFSAIFHLFWGASSPIGNLIASIIFSMETKADDVSDVYEISSNESLSLNMTSPDDGSDICGANHCPFLSEHLDVLHRPSKSLVYALMACFLVFNILGLVLSGFLTPLSTPRNSSASQKLVQTVKLVRDPNLLLMLPSFLLVGILPSMFYGSYAQVRGEVRKEDVYIFKL